ncbi:hypothetical protein EJ08DRAFT_101676 [Tothia fuscella]|uniref:Uncharacterized protein n=1 Tax=Tothia fuscella TaxID=1048955 RepID=A0A9P4U1H2_9PEZI|nr:hypothetical protein EJ08DRAFT_101676 [Tothia fuscella]
MHKNANSVFLAPSNGWTAFDDRECVGALIGNIAGGCLRLDAGADRKIQCVTSRKNDRVAPRAVDIDATSESASAPATWPKANEYETDNCSGKMLHEHHGLSIGNVQMDDASHSVYLAKGTGFGPWHAWSDKEAAPGKNCVGFELGEMGGGCIKLDNFGPDRKRVRCVGGSAA